MFVSERGEGEGQRERGVRESEGICERVAKEGNSSEGEREGERGAGAGAEAGVGAGAGGREGE